MSKEIKSKKIAEQFSHFIESRKESRRAQRPFSDEFLKKLTPGGEEGKSVMSSNKPQASRRHQPPARLAGKARRISKLQAKRLARYAPYIEASARKYNVPVELICGVMLQESGGQHKAVSHCGARGLMQLMPGTAKRFGVKNSFDPQQNIDGGTRYLGWLLKHFKGDIKLVLAGYNSGEGNVKKYGNKIPPFKETQNYVPAVMGYTQSMIDIFVAKRSATLPGHARRV